MKIILTILILVIPFYSNQNIWGNESLQYVLTQKKIKNTWLRKTPRGTYLVDVELRKKDKENFAKITADNVGKRLEILFSGKILIRPIIRGKINSGRILAGEFSSEETVKVLMESLLPSQKTDNNSSFAPLKCIKF